MLLIALPKQKSRSVAAYSTCLIPTRVAEPSGRIVNFKSILGGSVPLEACSLMKHRFTLALDFTMTSMALTEGRSGSVLLAAEEVPDEAGAVARPAVAETSGVRVAGSRKEYHQGALTRRCHQGLFAAQARSFLVGMVLLQPRASSQNHFDCGGLKRLRWQLPFGHRFFRCSVLLCRFRRLFFGCS